MTNLTTLYVDPKSTVRITVKLPGTPEGAYVLLRSITVFGKTYASVQEAVRSLDAHEEGVIKRLKKLYRSTWKADSLNASPSPEEINRAFLPQHIVVKGRVFPNVSTAAMHHKVPSSYAIRRVRKLPSGAGEAAIDGIFDRAEYIRYRRKRRFYAKGAWHATLAKACRVNGVDQQTVLRKMAALDTPSQEEIDVLFEPPATHTRNPEPITVKGISYPSITAACKALGMRQNTVDGRLKRIPERTSFWIDACFEKEMPKLIYRTSWAGNIKVRGKTFNSVKDACEEFESYYPTVRRRLHRLPEWVTQDQIDACFR